MTWMRELIGTGLLLTGSAAFIVAVEQWTRRSLPPAEWSRKIIHIGGLIPCLLIPVVIHSIWIALILSLLFAAGLYINERLGTLESVSRVQRKTSGTAYYPVAVFLVFVLSEGRTWMYISAILALCLGDALAAIVGKVFSRIHFDVEDQWKSLEGSMVFLFVTFLAVFLPLLIMTTIPLPTCLLVALLTALLVTGYEAISLEGFDNLFVPVGVCLVLDRAVLLSLPELLARNLLLIGLLVGLTFLVRLSRQLDFGATLVIVLYTFTAIALADWYWALAPLGGLALFIFFRTLFPPVEVYSSRVKVALAVRVLLPLLLVLALANATGEYAFMQGPYVVCASVSLCFIVRVFLSWRKVGPPRIHPVLIALSGAGAGVVLALPPWGLQRAPLAALTGLTAICAILSIVHEWTLPRDRPKTVQDFWTFPRILLVCAAVLGVMLLQRWNVIPLWPGLATQVQGGGA